LLPFPFIVLDISLETDSYHCSHTAIGSEGLRPPVSSDIASTPFVDLLRISLFNKRISTF